VPIVGVSAGCPYALACAAQVPDRVSGMSILAGFGPVSARGRGGRLPYLVGRTLPPLYEYVLASRAALGRTDPDRFLESKAADVSEADAASWKGTTGYVVLESTVEGARDGVDGYLAEGKLLARTWPFDLADVAIPVSLYYGDNDTLAPPPMREALAAGIPEPDLTVDSDLGHLSVMEQHGRTALERVIAEDA
jgi:pimeloyl-ACP methyl ester carboxylesterase